MTIPIASNPETWRTRLHGSCAAAQAEGDPHSRPADQYYKYNVKVPYFSNLVRCRRDDLCTKRAWKKITRDRCDE